MIRLGLAVFLGIYFLPLALHAAWWSAQGNHGSWSQADWSSTGILPPPQAKQGAMIHVYAGRVGRWRGIFAHHSWIVLKEEGAERYTRYDKVAWGRPVRTDNWAPDGRWYGNPPILIAAIEGPQAAALIPRIRAAVAEYPYGNPGDYRAWPGPNSNSFVAHVLAAVPEWSVALPPTAVGKDWQGEGFRAGLTPSGTGVTASLSGLLGFTAGWVEGIEVNLLALVIGIDIRRPAIKLPGIGRIGVDPVV